MHNFENLSVPHRRGRAAAFGEASLQQKLGVPDDEFGKWKWAYHSLGRTEYLEEEDAAGAVSEQESVWRVQNYLASSARTRTLERPPRTTGTEATIKNPSRSTDDRGARSARCLRCIPRFSLEGFGASHHPFGRDARASG